MRGGGGSRDDKRVMGSRQKNCIATMPINLTEEHELQNQAPHSTTQ